MRFLSWKCFWKVAYNLSTGKKKKEEEEEKAYPESYNSNSKDEKFLQSIYLETILR